LRIGKDWLYLRRTQFELKAAEPLDPVRWMIPEADEDAGGRVM
jgi:hypothetical protein